MEMSLELGHAEIDSILPPLHHQDHYPFHPMELSQWNLQTSTFLWVDDQHETLKNIIFVLDIN